MFTGKWTEDSSSSKQKKLQKAKNIKNTNLIYTTYVEINIIHSVLIRPGPARGVLSIYLLPLVLWVD